MLQKHAVWIPINRLKLWSMVIAASLFVLLGFIFILYPDSFRTRLIPRGNWVIVLGFTIQIVFGYFIGTLVPRLRNKDSGLLIDRSGIIDQSTEFSVGKIPWEGVKSIYKKKMAGSKFMLVEVKDPDFFIEKAEKKTLKKALRRNFRIFGTPAVITATNLKCRFTELEKQLLAAYQVYKK